MSRHAETLKTKLLGAFVLFALAPMLCIAIYSFYAIKSEITSSALSHLEAIAKIKSLQIERFHKRTKDYVLEIQNSPYVHNILSINPNSSAFKADKTLLTRQFNQYLSTNAIDEIYIMRPDGKVVVEAVNDDEDKLAALNKTMLEQGKTKTYFSDLYKGHEQNKSYLFAVSAPILDNNGKLIGVALIEFTANSFFDEIQDYSGLGDSGETLLGRKRGNEVIFLNPLRHDPDAAMSRSAKIDGQVARPAIMAASGQTGSGQSIDYRGEKVFAAWRYIPDINIGMVAKIDAREVLKPLEIIKSSVIITAFILLAFGVAISLRTSINFARPMHNLETIANIDNLTGLPNRRRMMELLEQALNDKRLKGSLIAIMFLDLDGFKSVNDTYGHEKGDLLLKKVAIKLSSCVRHSDTVARLGGDEFIILLNGIKEVDNITKIANNIIQVIGEQFSLNGPIVNIGVSIGVSVYGQHAYDIDEMLKKADEAMYEVKKMGKNSFKFADESQKEA